MILAKWSKGKSNGTTSFVKNSAANIEAIVDRKKVMRREGQEGSTCTHIRTHMLSMCSLNVSNMYIHAVFVCNLER